MNTQYVSRELITDIKKNFEQLKNFIQSSKKKYPMEYTFSMPILSEVGLIFGRLIRSSFHHQKKVSEKLTNIADLLFELANRLTVLNLEWLAKQIREFALQIVQLLPSNFYQIPLFSTMVYSSSSTKPLMFNCFTNWVSEQLSKMIFAKKKIVKRENLNYQFSLFPTAP